VRSGREPHPEIAIACLQFRSIEAPSPLFDPPAADMPGTEGSGMDCLEQLHGRHSRFCDSILHSDRTHPVGSLRPRGAKEKRAPCASRYVNASVCMTRMTCSHMHYARGSSRDSNDCNYACIAGRI
jgi:hypothetical protein